MRPASSMPAASASRRCRPAVRGGRGDRWCRTRRGRGTGPSRRPAPPWPGRPPPPGRTARKADRTASARAGASSPAPASRSDVEVGVGSRSAGMVEVDAGTDHDAAVGRRPGEDAADLVPVDLHVVRPLHGDVRAGRQDRRDRVAHRRAGDQRQPAAVVVVQVRADEHARGERLAGRSGPRPVEPTPTRGLVQRREDAAVLLLRVRRRRSALVEPVSAGLVDGRARRPDRLADAGNDGDGDVDMHANVRAGTVGVLQPAVPTRR